MYGQEKSARLDVRMDKDVKAELQAIAADASKVIPRDRDTYYHYHVGITVTDIIAFALSKTFPRGALKDPKKTYRDSYGADRKVAQIEHVSKVATKAAAASVKKKKAPKTLAKVFGKKKRKTSR